MIQVIKEYVSIPRRESYKLQPAESQAERGTSLFQSLEGSRISCNDRTLLAPADCEFQSLEGSRISCNADF